MRVFQDEESLGIIWPGPTAERPSGRAERTRGGIWICVDEEGRTIYTEERGVQRRERRARDNGQEWRSEQKAGRMKDAGVDEINGEDQRRDEGGRGTLQASISFLPTCSSQSLSAGTNTHTFVCKATWNQPTPYLAAGQYFSCRQNRRSRAASRPDWSLKWRYCIVLRIAPFPKKPRELVRYGMIRCQPWPVHLCAAYAVLHMLCTGQTRKRNCGMDAWMDHGWTMGSTPDIFLLTFGIIHTNYNSYVLCTPCCVCIHMYSIHILYSSYVRLVA